jgi:hypothetical protein
MRSKNKTWVETGADAGDFGDFLGRDEARELVDGCRLRLGMIECVFNAGGVGVDVLTGESSIQTAPQVTDSAGDLNLNDVQRSGITSQVSTHSTPLTMEVHGDGIDGAESDISVGSQAETAAVDGWDSDCTVVDEDAIPAGQPNPPLLAFRVEDEEDPFQRQSWLVRDDAVAASYDDNNENNDNDDVPPGSPDLLAEEASQENAERRSSAADAAMLTFAFAADTVAVSVSVDVSPTPTTRTDSKPEGGSVADTQALQDTQEAAAAEKAVSGKRLVRGRKAVVSVHESGARNDEPGSKPVVPVDEGGAEVTDKLQPEDDGQVECLPADEVVVVDVSMPVVAAAPEFIYEEGGESQVKDADLSESKAPRKGRKPGRQAAAAKSKIDLTKNTVTSAATVSNVGCDALAVISEGHAMDTSASSKAQESAKPTRGRKRALGQKGEDQQSSASEAVAGDILMSIKQNEAVSLSPSPFKAASVSAEGASKSIAAANVVVIFTGIEREDELVAAIGATVTESPEEATHMIIGDELRRTPKLMVALNAGVKYVVSLDWLHKSAAKGCPLPVTVAKGSKFLLRDAAKEKLWGFELWRTLSLPRGPGHRGVFTGMSILVTPGVCGVRAPKEDELRAIIASGGGDMLGPSLSIPADVDCLVVSSAEVAPTLSMELIEKASRGSGQGVYSMELIFLAVLRQAVRLDQDILVTAGSSSRPSVAATEPDSERVAKRARRK